MFIPHLANMASTLAAANPTVPPASPASPAQAANLHQSPNSSATQATTTAHAAQPPAATTATAATAQAAQAAQEQRAAPVDDQQLQALAEQVQERLQTKASNLVFSLDEESGRTVVKVVDRQTQEVIKQIPSEEMVALAKALEDMQDALDISGVLDTGVLVKQQA